MSSSIIPSPIITILRRIKYKLEDKRNANKSPREVFAEIYSQGKWGKTEKEFCSGLGSVTEEISQPYVKMIINFLNSGNQSNTVVDLGCGDMEIGKKIINHCTQYVGVDVVPGLIKKHNRTNWGKHVSFHCLDIIEDDLPDGDICLIRQVLEHLSNEEIKRILPKLKKYKNIFITEHYPHENSTIIPNIDITRGSRIRAHHNSGVYLNKPPFNALKKNLEMQVQK